jgi:hypothetical protein
MSSLFLYILSFFAYKIKARLPNNTSIAGVIGVIIVLPLAAATQYFWLAESNIGLLTLSSSFC